MPEWGPEVTSVPLPSIPPAIPLSPERVFAALCEAAIAHRSDLYLVGGYVRDACLGRAPLDIDVITSESPFELGRSVARVLGGHFVVLDADFGVGRLVLPGDRVVDLARMQAETIEADLRRRDLTINAIALPLVQAGQRVHESGLLDPTGGLGDLAHRVIRAVAVENLLADPVRLIRILRFGAMLDFKIDFETLAWLETFKRKLLDAAAERTTAELLKILALPAAFPWIERLFGLGVLGLLVPEFTMLGRLPADPNASLDARAKALESARQFEAVLAALTAAFPTHSEAIERHLAADLGSGAHAHELAKLSTLLLEIGKPFCRAYDAQGRLTYDGHEAEGARRTEAVADRLKLSTKAKTFLSTIVAHRQQAHRLLQTPCDPVALHRLFRSAGDASVALLLVILAEHRATQPPGAREDTKKAVELVLDAYFRPDGALTNPPRLLDGKELMGALGLKPGKQVGVLLEAVLAAQLRGEVRTKDEAIAWAAQRTDER